MPKTHRILLALCLIAGLATSSIEAQAATVEQAAAINGADTDSHYAVITPTYLGTDTGPQSFVRLFNGSRLAGSSTFTVTVVGLPSGRTYGPGFTAAVPRMASIQMSIQEVLSFAGAGSLTGGDTGYAVYLQNSDDAAGYQHVVYDWTSQLFENMSNCATSLNEQMVDQNNEMILTNVHTSKIGGGNFPSTIVIHNYSNVAKTYRLDVYNGGSKAGGSTFSATAISGKLACQLKDKTVAANSSLSMSFSSIETNTSCTLDSDTQYANIALVDQSGAPPYAVLTHSVRVAAYNGNTDMSAACAVNKRVIAQVTSATTFKGTVAGTGNESGTISTTVQSGGTSTASALARAQGRVERARAIVQVSGTLLLTGKSAITLSGTYNSNTNAVVVSGGGYSFTGTVANGAVEGTYTGPNNSTGTFSLLNATAGVVVAYCGTFSGTVTRAPFLGNLTNSGVWNMQVSATGAASGTYQETQRSPSCSPTLSSDCALKSGTVAGQASGSSFDGTATDGGTVHGTIPDTTISGTYGDGLYGAQGTFTGAQCALP